MIKVNVLLLAFRWALKVSIPSCILIVLILFVKKAFDGKLSASFHYYIWLLLVVRLVIPYMPQSSVSALNLFAPLYGIGTHSEISAVNGANTNTQSYAGKVSYGIKGQRASSGPGSMNGDNKNANTTFPYKNLELCLAGVWLCGVLLYIAYALVSNLRFNIKLKSSVPVSDAGVLEIYGKCKSALGINCDIPVLYTEAVGTPSLYGIRRPKVLLPKKLAGKLTGKEPEYVFLHELAHYKRKDIQVIFAVTLIKAFYWFNPFIWYAFYRMRTDCENSCDAVAMSHISAEEHTGYGYLLIHLLELWASSKSLTASAACIISKGINKAQLKRRINMISNFKKSISTKQIALSAILIVAVGLIGLTGAKGISSKSVPASSALFNGPETVMPATGKDAALYWADTLAQRDGAARFAILSNDLKSKEYKNYKELNWVIGGSSPWVTSYSVKENGTTKESTEFIINYFFSDSTRAKYKGTETVTVKQSGENWFVVGHKGTDNYGYPELSGCKGLYNEVTFPPTPSMLPTKTAKGAASLWAEGLKTRNGAYRFACLSSRFKCLSSDLQDNECDEYQKKNWLIGA